MTSQSEQRMPAEVLEQRAAEERLRIHECVSGLRSSLTDMKTSVEENIREHLDASRFARRHLWQTAAGASALALFLGYGIAGMFTRR